MTPQKVGQVGHEVGHEVGAKSPRLLRGRASRALRACVYGVFHSNAGTPAIKVPRACIGLFLRPTCPTFHMFTGFYVLPHVLPHVLLVLPLKKESDSHGNRTLPALRARRLPAGLRSAVLHRPLHCPAQNAGPAARAAAKRAPKALPPPPKALPALSGELQTRINKRAWELAHAAFGDYRKRMMDDVMLKSGHTQPEAWPSEWTPLENSQDVLESIYVTASLLEAHANSIHIRGRRLAEMVGKDYVQATKKYRP